VTAVPVGVAGDRSAGDGIERETLRVEPSGGGDRAGAFDVVGEPAEPVEDVHPADAAADDGVEPADAEGVQ